MTANSYALAARLTCMNTTRLLRLEGAAVFVAALTVFIATDQPWWLLAVLALAPDLGMLGYLAGPRVGAATYNAVHLYLGPLAAAGAWALGVGWALPVALVWAAHVGADRAFGYGLKEVTGFHDTHLSSDTDTDADPPVGSGSGTPAR